MGTIHRDNYAALIFCEEIILYCEQIIYFHRELENAAQHRLKLHSGEDSTEPYTPPVTIHVCAGILNSAKSLKNILYGAGNHKSKYKNRAAKVRLMLGNPTLSAIQNVDTRNKWEHLDEYLQDYLEKSGPKSINQLEVYDGLYKQNPETFHLRAFNPKTLEIRHDKYVSCAKSLAADAVTLMALAKAAIKQMGQGTTFQII